MDNTVIYIKCPKCGKVLGLKNQPGIERLFVPCPACGTRSPFASCERVVKKQVDKATELPSSLKADKVFLVDSATGSSYELPLGSNSVGRAHATSTAKVQITTTDRGMSRVHSVINVVKTSSGNLRCFISNANNKNATYVNGEKLEDGDEIVLHDGDVLKMSVSEFKVKI